MRPETVENETWRRPPKEAVVSQPDLPLNPSPEEAEKLALRSALEEYSREVRAEPDSAWAWYRYGDALLGLKRSEEAVPALRKAIELAPDIPIFHYDLGLALYDLNEAEAASEHFNQIVLRDPTLEYASSTLGLSAITNLALCQEKLKQRDEAIQTLLPALRDAVGVLFNLAFLHFKAKRYEAALPYIQAAFILKPNNEDIVHQYGSTLSELNRPREAIKYLKQAVELQPDCARAWYDLGLAYARLKRRKSARKYFLQSLQVDPERMWPHYDLACLDALEGKRDTAFKHLMQAAVRGLNSRSTAS